MSHKFRIRRDCKAGECFENSSDILESVYNCDLCKKEMARTPEGYVEGGRLNYQKGNNITNRYAFCVDVCDDCCINKVQETIGYKED